MLPALFGKKKKETDYKAKLERKLYLAREDPEPVFDLSDCALRQVPTGVYSLCRVFRKEMLYLQENQLTSLSGGGNLLDLCLLQVLDIHSNHLAHLPEDIHLLSNLKVLNVCSNQLKALPDSIGCLSRLELLNASSNNLHAVPSSVSKLRYLRTLDLRNNVHLSSVPTSMAFLESLQHLLLDHAQFVHPPCFVVEQGTDAVRKFLCAELGIQYVQRTEHSDTPPNNYNAMLDQETHFEEKLRLLEREKEQRQRERIAVEQQLEELRKKEVEVQNMMKLNKNKLLEHLVDEQRHLERELEKLQLDRDASRTLLIDQLQQAEQSADCVISQLLSLSSSSRNSAQLHHLLDQEMKEEERLLSEVQDQYRSLRRKEILEAMETLLKEECCRDAKLREYEEGRAETSRTLLSLEVEMDKRLAGLLESQTQVQKELVSRVHRDEELQRAAVAALLEREDARSCALVHQVAVVEQQLAALTAIEMKRRKLHLSEQMVQLFTNYLFAVHAELSQKRISLSGVLVDLLAQQSKRQRQLLGILQQMEKQRWSLDQGKVSEEDFWLRQYQRLIDSRPCSLVELERHLDPALAHCLVMFGAIHCLPFLSTWLQPQERLQLLTDDQLKQAGVSLPQDRAAILEAVHMYLEDVKVASSHPSSPPLSYLDDEVAASECAICMDHKCEMIFVPCGHMCCCTKCSEVLQQCPLCRTNIDQKVRVIKS